MIPWHYLLLMVARDMNIPPTNTVDDLLSFVSRLADAKVTCIGDVMLDRFVYGEVDRISPEAPIPVLRVTHEHDVLGGAGNVVQNLTAVGATCRLYSVVGDDPSGARVRELLQALPSCEPHLTVSRHIITPTKCRYIARPQQMLRVDRETLRAAARDPGSQDDRAWSLVQDLDSVVVLSDYGKGVLHARLLRTVIDRARQDKRLVVVDPKGTDYSRYAGANYITPNRAELNRATGMPTATLDEVAAAARALINQHDFDAVVATLSEQGILLVRRYGPLEHFAAEAREVYDITGAGDTVVAIFAAALAIGAALPIAVRLGNVAAGIVVGKVGTASVRPDELLRALRFHSPDPEEKVVDLEQARHYVSRWRQEGKRIGFTNGCFDLLHPGHIALLNNAASKVDYLIVGLNSDSSVSRLKGPSRPLQQEGSRAIVLAALCSVALVVVFPEDTPERLIRELRPDLLIKGADYTIDAVIGAEFVQSYGGEVLLVDIVPQHSTTRLVRQIEDTKR